MDIPTAGSTEECDFTNTGVQGGVLTPTLFKPTMETTTEATVLQWNKKGRGINLGGKLAKRFWWTDNLYLLATSRAMLRQMIIDVTEALEEHKIYWKPSSAEIMVSPTVPQNDRYMEVPAHTITGDSTTLKSRFIERISVLGNLVNKVTEH